MERESEARRLAQQQEDERAHAHPRIPDLISPPLDGALTRAELQAQIRRNWGGGEFSETEAAAALQLPPGMPLPARPRASGVSPEEMASLLQRPPLIALPPRRGRFGQDDGFNHQNGMRARSTNITHADGSVSRVISIGVPEDHLFADPDSHAGNQGLRNLRIGPIRLPAPPTFVIRIKRG